MATQKAYWKDTDIEVQPGETIKDFRGDPDIFERVDRDSGPGYSAKVLTRGNWAYYSSAFPDIEVR